MNIKVKAQLLCNTKLIQFAYFLHNVHNSLLKLKKALFGVILTVKILGWWHGTLNLHLWCEIQFPVHGFWTATSDDLTSRVLTTQVGDLAVPSSWLWPEPATWVANSSSGCSASHPAPC